MSTDVSFRSIAKISGWLLLFEGVLLCVPCLTGVIYRESDWSAFAVAAVAAIAAGLSLCIPLRHVKTRLRRREGYLLTSLVWVLFSLFGMIPF